MDDTATPTGARWRSHAAMLIVGAATLALAAGGLTAPAPAQAEKIWDLGAYDACAKAALDRYEQKKTDAATFADEVRFCCDMSGGQYNSAAMKCEAPPATFQTAPQRPRDVVAPRPGTATPLP